MSRKHTPFLENRTVGHVLAVLFFIGLGFALFVAASQMNYIWKWNSVPKYFAYEKESTLEAPFDGTISIDGDTVTIRGETESKTYDVTGYTLRYENGEKIYEGDALGSKKEWTAGPLTNGLIVTLKISALSALLSLLIGTITAFMKLSRFQFLKDIATVYITVIRGTPLLVQIFIFYFIVATIFDIPRFYAGVVSLGIFYGAYLAEVLRGAIQSIDVGQYEAAKSLGMGTLTTMRYIIMPQALKRALPALVGEVIALVKDSSLVSVISITDLTKVGREIVANTFSPFETWIIVALIYFAITFSLSIVGHRIEKRMRERGGY
jgi:polar amino acid transport system permease protein